MQISRSWRPVILIAVALGCGVVVCGMTSHGARVIASIVSFAERKGGELMPPEEASSIASIIPSDPDLIPLETEAMSSSQTAVPAWASVAPTPVAPIAASVVQIPISSSSAKPEPIETLDPQPTFSGNWWDLPQDKQMSMPLPHSTTPELQPVQLPNGWPDCWHEAATYVNEERCENACPAMLYECFCLPGDTGAILYLSNRGELERCATLMEKRWSIEEPLFYVP